VLEPVAGRAVRVVKRRRAQNHVIVRVQQFARAKIVKLDVRLENLDLDGEQGRTHDLSRDLFDAVMGQQVARPQPHTIVVGKKGGKKREADHVIEMAVGQENIDLRD